MQGAVAIDYIYGGIWGALGFERCCSTQRRRERRGKRRERIVRVGGGFILCLGAGRVRAPPGAVLAKARGGVLRWGGSAGVGRGCCRLDSGSAVSPGSPGSAREG